MSAIDMDMSEFTPKTTLASTDFIVGTLADGSAVKIKVSDIATVVAGMIGEANDNKNGLMSSLFFNYNKGITDFTQSSDNNQYLWNYIKLIEFRNIGVNGFISVTSNYAEAWAKRPIAILPFMFRSYQTGEEATRDFMISKMMANSYISDVHFYYVFEQGKSTIYCSKTSHCSVNALVLHSDNYWGTRAIVYNEKVESLPDGAVEISY